MKDIETPDNQNSFVRKLFDCCLCKNNNDLELNDEKDLTSRDNFLLIKAKNELESQFLIFPAGTIREEERDKIQFTKEGLLEFISDLQNLKYEIIYCENNLKISKRNSSIITDKFPLIRCEVIKNKSFFRKVPKIQRLLETMTKPELRKKWDNNIKEYRIIEKINNNSEIIKTIFNRQLAIINENEYYDKRIEIVNNGIYYLFSSSIPDSNNFISLDYDKAINYLNVMIVKQDEENFYFDFFNQIDININLPKNFIESNLPNKTISFFEKYFEFLNIL